jgi:hypothetical protein
VTHVEDSSGGMASNCKVLSGTLASMNLAHQMQETSAG